MLKEFLEYLSTFINLTKFGRSGSADFNEGASSIKARATATFCDFDGLNPYLRRVNSPTCRISLFLSGFVSGVFCLMRLVNAISFSCRKKFSNI